MVEFHDGVAVGGGAAATQGKSAMPGPLDVAKTIWGQLADPFDDGTNDKGRASGSPSIARVGIDDLLAVAVAIPIGFLIGMSPLMSAQLDFIQVMKAIALA